MRKLAKQLQIDVRNFTEIKKTKNERRFDVTLGNSITVRDVYVFKSLFTVFVSRFYLNYLTIFDKISSSFSFLPVSQLIPLYPFAHAHV